MRMVQLTKQEKENILENLLKRSPNQYDEYQEAVNEILENVKKEGDKAVFDYTKRFDKANISKETLYVTEEEIKEAYSLVDADLIETMKKSIANIRDFHERQVRNSWFHTREDGVILGQRITALASVGVYVPGGKAAYPSSVLMNIIPAKVAGVKRIPFSWQGQQKYYRDLQFYLLSELIPFHKRALQSPVHRQPLQLLRRRPNEQLPK